jgi:hypothetical protein
MRKNNRNPISISYFDVTQQFSKPPLAALSFILPHTNAITVIEIPDYSISKIFRTFLGDSGFMIQRFLIYHNVISDSTGLCYHHRSLPA